MKDLLTKLLEKRQARIAEIKSLVEASTNIDEVRTLTSEASALQEEVRDIESQIAEMEAKSNVPAGVPANAQLVNGNVVGSYKKEVREEEPTASMEYRKAFMAYIQKGTAMPQDVLQRAGVAINTSDTGPAIPVTVMNEVINTVKGKYGNLYSKVTKLSVVGGVDIPIGALKATFKWIGESTVSPRQKLDALGAISFKYHTAEIRLAQSFLSRIVTISAFEAKLAEIIAEAYLEAMDYGIVRGSGNGSMLGIVNDARVTNYITMSANDMADWTKWRSKLFAKLPLGYRAGEFIFPLSTVETYLETMADANNNPIFKQAAGLDVNEGDASGRFFGRAISLVEEDILPDFGTASANDVIGIYWQPKEYAINENFGFTMMHYFDQKTNDYVDKALTVVDGKVINPTGIYLIKKGS